MGSPRRSPREVSRELSPHSGSYHGKDNDREGFTRTAVWENEEMNRSIQ